MGVRLPGGDHDGVLGKTSQWTPGLAADFDKWYADNSLGHTHPVGGTKANPWGLYDIPGNVWQWCADSYDKDYYAKSPIKDPQDTNSERSRVLRGGSWYHDARDCRSAYRYAYEPAYCDGSLGVRVVLRAAADIGKEVCDKQPLFDPWLKQTGWVASGTTGQSCCSELKKRNLGFDGTIKPSIEDGVVTGLEFLTDEVTDISPVRALPGLKSLSCQGSAVGTVGTGKLSDLSPLEGLVV